MNGAQLLLWLGVFLCATGQAVAAKCADEAPATKGTGRIVSGIILTSVTVPVALITGFAVGYAMADCGHSDAPEEKNCHQEDRGWKVGVATAGLLTAGGLTGGIYLIQRGREQRQAWRDYQTCESSSIHVYERGLRFEGLSLRPSGAGGTALAFSASIY